jgi:hypothetical protein
MADRSARFLSLFSCRCHPLIVRRMALRASRLTAGEKFTLTRPYLSTALRGRKYTRET